MPTGNSEGLSIILVLLSCGRLFTAPILQAGEAKVRAKHPGDTGMSYVTLGERINILILSFLDCKMGIKSTCLSVVEKTVCKLYTEHLAQDVGRVKSQ